MARTTAIHSVLAALALTGITATTARAQGEPEPEPAADLAQEPRPHEGFWLTGGLGAGLDDDEEVGAAAYIRLGGTLGPRLLLGGEFIGLAREVDDATVSRGNATAIAVLYPSETGGLFLKGGLGIAVVDLSEPGDVDVSVSDQAFGATLGAGYDLRLGDNLYLTPNLDMLYQGSSDLSDSAVLWLLTVGLGFH